MAGAYAYTPAIWPALAGAIFLAAIGLYSWRRRSMPAALPLAAVALFCIFWLLGIAFEAAAVAPATKIAWFKFQGLWRAPVATAGLCFVLEYAYPGRWLTRRNLILLALPLLLDILLVVADDSWLMWRRLQVSPEGSVLAEFATPGIILTFYGVSLLLVNIVALLWLFIRSPQHRWPVALILFGQIAGRALYVTDAAHLPWPGALDPIVLAILLLFTMYATALFGFRIFDPVPGARQAAIEQMQAGMVVFDTGWRVLSLNPAAEGILGVRTWSARGKTWQELAPPGAHLPPLLDENAGRAGANLEAADVTFGSGSDARSFAPALSLLRDFRGLVVGHLLVLRDVSEQRQTQARVLEQERMLAVLHERERLAREVHDSIGQVLGYAGLQLETVHDCIVDGQAAVSAGQRVDAEAHLEEAEKHISRLSSIVEEAHADIREYILKLRLAPSDQRPFFGILRHYLDGYSQNYGIQAELSVGPGVDEGTLDSGAQMQLFRLMQEALSNARKHAGASCVQIAFEAADGMLHIQIQDNGRGFDPALPSSDGDSHFGLRFMHERAEEIGGDLRVDSVPGEGTCVEVEVPIGGSHYA